MLVSVSLLISVCLSLTLVDSKEAGLTSLQHQYHPYHQYRANNYQNNRRTFQRALNLHHLHHNYRSQAKHGVKVQPSPPVRREDKKLFPIFPSQENLHLHTTYHRRPSPAHRAQRKIEVEPSKLDRQFVKNKSNAKKKIERKEEDDNIAVESNILETRVRPDPPVAAVKKSYSSPEPKLPKFIIKQAGPSQQFGWLGHGRFAPLNIPNIFKTVGLNTAWLPGVNSVFPVGLNYPAPPGPASHHKHSPGPAPVKKTTTVAPPPPPVTTEKYQAPATTTTTTSSSLGSIPVYQPSHHTPLPAYRPASNQNQIETLYYGSQIVNLYTPPAKTTTTTATTTTTTTATTPTTTTYKAVTTTPTLKYTYKTYKTTSRPVAPFRYSSPPVTTPSPVYRSPSFISSPAPHYGYGSPQPSIAPYHSTPHFGYGSPQPSIAPYHSTPHYGYGSPQPSIAPHRNYQHPSSVRPFTAFTAFSRSTPAPAPAPAKAPIVGIIETEEKNSEQGGDGEVFYIFYENEDLPEVWADKSSEQKYNSFSKLISENPQFRCEAIYSRGNS